MIMPVRWCRFPFYGKGFGPGKPGEGEHGQGDVGVPGGGDHADEVGDDEAGERRPVVGYAVQLAYRGRHPRGDSHRLERHQRHRDQQTDRGQAQAPRNTPAGTAGLCAPSCSGAGRGPDLRLDFSATPAVRPDRGLQVAAPSRAFSVVDQRCSRSGRVSAWVGTSSLVQVGNHRGAAAARVRGGPSWVAGSRSEPRHRPGSRSKPRSCRAAANRLSVSCHCWVAAPGRVWHSCRPSRRRTWCSSLRTSTGCATNGDCGQVAV